MSHPAAGDSGFQVWHQAGIGCTAYLVLFTGVTRWAFKSGICLYEWPDSPAAAWYSFVFCPKTGIFRPAGGAISFWVSNRVPRVIYRSYAVGMQPGRFTRCRPDSPAAAWYFFSFCPEKLHVVQLFWATALPEATFRAGSVTTYVLLFMKKTMLPQAQTVFIERDIRGACPPHHAWDFHAG